MREIYNKFEKNHFGIIILAQSIVILLLVFYIVTLNRVPALSNATQENTFSEEISRDVSACLSLNFSERAACAKIVGTKIKQMFNSEQERFKECMKFKPLYIRECQQSLSETE